MGSTLGAIKGGSRSLDDGSHLRCPRCFLKRFGPEAQGAAISRNIHNWGGTFGGFSKKGDLTDI